MKNCTKALTEIRRDHSPQVRAHAEHIFGIYGLEDGLLTGKVLDQISERLKANPHPHRLQTIAGASHSLYIDQQALLFKAIDRIMKSE